MSQRADLVLNIGDDKGVAINSATGALEPIKDGRTSLGSAGAAASAMRFAQVLAEVLTSQSDAGVRCRVVPMEEEITLATDGLTTDSSENLLLAGALVLPVITEVTTTITTSTDWAVGVSGTAGKFLAASSNALTAGTIKIGAAHWAGTVAIYNASAAKVRITASTNNPGAGKVRVTVFNIVFDKAS